MLGFDLTAKIDAVPISTHVGGLIFYQYNHEREYTFYIYVDIKKATDVCQIIDTKFSQDLLTIDFIVGIDSQEIFFEVPPIIITPECRLVYQVDEELTLKSASEFVQEKYGLDKLASVESATITIYA